MSFFVGQVNPVVESIERTTASPTVHDLNHVLLCWPGQLIERLTAPPMVHDLNHWNRRLLLRTTEATRHHPGKPQIPNTVHPRLTGSEKRNNLRITVFADQVNPTVESIERPTTLPTVHYPNHQSLRLLLRTTEAARDHAGTPESPNTG